MADFQMKTVDGTTVRRAASPEVAKGNQGVAALLGKASIGQAVSNAGQQLGAYAEREKRAREAASMSDARRTALDGLDEDLGELKKAASMSDLAADLTEDAFMEKASTLIGDRAASIGNQGDSLSPEASRQLTEFSKEFEFKSLNQAKTMYRRIRADRLQTKFIATADAMYSRGDLDAGDAELDRMVEAGLEFPEEIENRKKKGRNFAHVELAKKDMLADPIDTLEELNSGGYNQLDDSQRMQLTREAETRVNRDRSARQMEYAERIESGELVSEAEIGEDVESGLLTSKQAKSIRNLQRGSSFDPVAYAGLMGKVNSYDPTTDKAGTGYATILGEILGMPPGHASELRKKLNQRAEGTADSSSSPVASASKELSRLHSADFFSGGMPTRTPEASLAASETYLSMQTALDRLALKNPDATSSELLSKALREPEAAPIRAAERARLLGDPQPIKPTDSDIEQAAKANRLVLIRSIYPSIESGMTMQDAIKAASSDAGGSLTPEQLQSISRAVKKGL